MSSSTSRTKKIVVRRIVVKKAGQGDKGVSALTYQHFPEDPALPALIPLRAVPPLNARIADVTFASGSCAAAHAGGVTMLQHAGAAKSHDVEHLIAQWRERQHVDEVDADGTGGQGAAPGGGATLSQYADRTNPRIAGAYVVTSLMPCDAADATVGMRRYIAVASGSDDSGHVVSMLSVGGPQFCIDGTNHRHHRILFLTLTMMRFINPARAGSMESLSAQDIATGKRALAIKADEASPAGICGRTVCLSADVGGGIHITDTSGKCFQVCAAAAATSVWRPTAGVVGMIANDNTFPVVVSLVSGAGVEIFVHRVLVGRRGADMSLLSSALLSSDAWEADAPAPAIVLLPTLQIILIGRPQLRFWTCDASTGQSTGHAALYEQHERDDQRSEWAVEMLPLPETAADVGAVPVLVRTNIGHVLLVIVRRQAQTAADERARLDAWLDEDDSDGATLDNRPRGQFHMAVRQWLFNQRQQGELKVRKLAFDLQTRCAFLQTSEVNHILQVPLHDLYPPPRDQPPTEATVAAPLQISTVSQPALAQPAKREESFLRSFITAFTGETLTGAPPLPPAADARLSPKLAAPAEEHLSPLPTARSQTQLSPTDSFCSSSSPDFSRSSRPRVAKALPTPKAAPPLPPPTRQPSYTYDKAAIETAMLFSKLTFEELRERSRVEEAECKERPCWRPAQSTLPAVTPVSEDEHTDAESDAAPPTAVLELRFVFEDVKRLQNYTSQFLSQLRRELDDDHSPLAWSTIEAGAAALEALKERDRVAFEIADVRLQYADRIAAIVCEEDVVVCENARWRDSQWVPHPSIRYQAEDGARIEWDLLNDTAQRSAALWSWSPRTAAPVQAAADESPHHRLWSTGPWLYATIFPPTDPAPASHWSPSPLPEHRVRRRWLSRPRLLADRIKEKEALELAMNKEIDLLKSQLEA